MLRKKTKVVALLITALLSTHAEAKDRKKKSEGEGLIIRSESEASLAVKDVAARLKDIKNRSDQAHNRLLALQDMLAQDSQDTATLDVGLLLNDEATQSLKILDAEFYLNQILIVNYTQPVSLEDNKTAFPVFSGTLPVGQYELTAKITTGLLPYGAVFKVAQGQWLSEKSFKFELAKPGKLSKVVAIKKAGDGPVLEWLDGRGSQ